MLADGLSSLCARTPAGIVTGWSSLYLQHMHYRQISNISRTLIENKIIDHSDVVGASPVGAAPTTSSLWTQHLPSCNGLGKDNCKTKQETF